MNRILVCQSIKIGAGRRMIIRKRMKSICNIPLFARYINTYRNIGMMSSILTRFLIFCHHPIDSPFKERLVFACIQNRRVTYFFYLVSRG
jgi:hypothetical protein